MKHNDRQYGIPFCEYNDTKANIEAITGLSEGCIAYATDTNELGTYDGSTWQWANLDYINQDVTTIGTPTFNSLTVTGSVVINEGGGDNDTRIEGDTDENLFYVDAGNDRIGVGTSNPGSKFNISDTQTNITARLLKANYIVNSTSSADHYYRVVDLVPEIHVDNGITNSGYVIGMAFDILRDQSDDLGTLSVLYSFYSAFGHSGATSRTTTIVAGINIKPYCRGGTITNLYGIRIGSLSTGGTVTNKWAIYSEFDAPSYFEGTVEGDDWLEHSQPLPTEKALPVILGIKNNKDGTFDKKSFAPGYRLTEHQITAEIDKDGKIIGEDHTEIRESVSLSSQVKYVIKAIQEQQVIIDNLSTDIEYLKSQLTKE